MRDNKSTESVDDYFERMVRENAYEFSNRYNKDLAKIIKRGIDVTPINEAVKKIVNDEEEIGL